MPGRSVTSVSGWPLIWPLLRSTVTPGKLPTCWLAPVSWLKSVVLPQFWLPASAKVSVWPSGMGSEWSRVRSSIPTVPPISPRPGWRTVAAAGAASGAGASPSGRGETPIFSASATRSVSW